MSNAAHMPLFNRPDTLLGICEGIGREFGFHPNILRVALAVPMIWNPIAVIGTYLGFGAALHISRLLAPSRPVSRRTSVNVTAGQNEEMALAA